MPLPRLLSRSSLLLALTLVSLAALAPARLRAEGDTRGRTADEKLLLDPNHSEVHFTLGDVLHIVHGTFHVQQGQIAFNPSTGQASGTVIVDAFSGQSGNSIRDHRMAKEELHAEDYKTVSFAPSSFTGTLNPTGDSTLKVHGLFTILGKPHPIDVPMQVQISGDQMHATGSFDVPYVDWGLKDPSTLMLRVNKQVQIDLSLIGSLLH